MILNSTILKLCVTIINLLSFVVVGHYGGVENLISYTLLLGIINISISIADFGLNAYNSNIANSNLNFALYSDKENNLDLFTFKVIISLVFFFSVQKSLNLNFLSILPWITLIFCRLYFMRRSTVLRRDVSPERSIIECELSISLIHFALLPIFFFDLNLYILSLLFFFVILKTFLSRKLEVKNLKIFGFGIIRKRLNLSYMSFVMQSYFTALKNNILSAILAITPIAFLNTVLVSTRLQQIILLVLSGFLVSLPKIIKQSKTSDKGIFNIFIGIMISTILIVYIFHNQIYELFNFLFNIPVENIDLFFIILSAFGASLSVFATFFITVGKPIRSLIIDIIYISLIVFYLNYVWF